jgi:hypothetical protein
MNRNVLIGGGVAGALALGAAGWYFLGGAPGSRTGTETAGEDQGPIALNPVAVVTDHSASQSEDGRMLSVTFPKFELVAKGGETTSAVFSTTWRLKLGANERAIASIASLQGYMKSAGTPPPTPTPAAPPTAQPAVADSGAPAAPAEGATPPAEKPAAAPAPAAPAKPVAGDGVARVVVTIGGETSVTEWRDWTGAGGEHQLSKAAAYVGTSADLRDGALVPVTVTVEVAGNTSTETISRLSSLVLRVVAEEAPIPTEPGTPGTGAETTPPATATPPAETPATPPAEGTPPPQ